MQHAFAPVRACAGKQVLAPHSSPMEPRCWCEARSWLRPARGRGERHPARRGGAGQAASAPRVRGLGTGELQLPTFTWAANADPLITATVAWIDAARRLSIA